MKKDTKVSAAQEVINMLEGKKINRVQGNYTKALKQFSDKSKQKVNKKRNSTNILII